MSVLQTIKVFRDCMIVVCCSCNTTSEKLLHNFTVNMKFHVWIIPKLDVEFSEMYRMLKFSKNVIKTDMSLIYPSVFENCNPMMRLTMQKRVYSYCNQRQLGIGNWSIPTHSKSRLTMQ